MNVDGLAENRNAVSVSNCSAIESERETTSLDEFSSLTHEEFLIHGHVMNEVWYYLCGLSQH